MLVVSFHCCFTAGTLLNEKEEPTDVYYVRSGFLGFMGTVSNMHTHTRTHARTHIHTHTHTLHYIANLLHQLLWSLQGHISQKVTCSRLHKRAERLAHFIQDKARFNSRHHIAFIYPPGELALLHIVNSSSVVSLLQALT